MKRFLIFLCAGIMFFGVAGAANAALINRGGGLIYDQDRNITWLQDANYANTSGYDDALYGYDTGGLMTWYECVAWADQLEYGGYNDWRLPSAYNEDGSGPDWTNYYDPPATGSELGHLYYTELGNSGPLTNPGSFINMQNYSYWFGTEYALDTNIAWEFAFHNSEQMAHNTKDYPLFAFAVRDGDVSSVPIPGALWLFGSGFIGVVGFRKKLKTGKMLPTIRNF